MDKLTLTRREAAALLGISIGTVSEWVNAGRLKAYRVSDKPKSPFLFTREDCMAALMVVPVTPRSEMATDKAPTEQAKPSASMQKKNVEKELDVLLKVRTKGRMKS